MTKVACIYTNIYIYIYTNNVVSINNCIYVGYICIHMHTKQPKSKRLSIQVSVMDMGGVGGRGHREVRERRM